MRLYFAYGANMNLAAMRRRCPASRPIGRGRLLGHQFFVCSDGYASIRRKAGAVVHGVAWNLAIKDEPALDRYESVASGLYVKRAAQVHGAGWSHSSLVYVARSKRAGPPASGYMEDVVAAAIRSALPAAYVRSLRSWLPQAVHGS